MVATVSPSNPYSVTTMLLRNPYRPSCSPIDDRCAPHDILRLLPELISSTNGRKDPEPAGEVHGGPEACQLCSVSSWIATVCRTEKSLYLRILQVFLLVLFNQ